MVASGGGRVIGVTSHTATHDPPAPVGQGGWGYAYAASKAAFHRLAGHVAVEFAEQGIVAFNGDPGHVLTERMLANAERLGLEGRYSGAPPTAPAAAVAWLATSPDAAALNGQTVSVHVPTQTVVAKLSTWPTALSPAAAGPTVAGVLALGAALHEGRL